MTNNYSFIQQATESSIVIAVKDDDSFFAPTILGHTGYAYDGFYYNAGVQDEMEIASWFSEESATTTRGISPAFPTSALVIMDRASMTILDTTNNGVALWMIFYFYDFGAFPNNFVPNDAPASYTGEFLTWANGRLTICSSADPGSELQPVNILTLDFASDQAYVDFPLSALPSDSLLGLWVMEEGSGTTFHDTSGNGNNLTFLSSIGTWGVVLGLPDVSFTFNKTGGAVGSNLSLTNFVGNTPFSVSAWVKFTSLTSQQAIVSTIDPAAADAGWELSQTGSGALEFFVENSASHLIDVTAGALTAGVLYFVVVTYNGTTHAAGVSIYVNAVLQTPTVVSDTLASNSAANGQAICIGQRTDGSAPMNGVIGAVRVYGDVLTQAQITAMYVALAS